MSDASYISTRRIGDATITVINEGVVRVPLTMVFREDAVAWLRAHGEATADDCLTTCQAVVVIQLGDATVVIDPAFDDPGTAWDSHFATLWPSVRRTPGLQVALASLGIAPESVTHVAITHAHDDHFAGVLQGDTPRFPNARHLLGQADWVGNPRHGQPEGDFAMRLGRIDALGLLDPVAGDHEIAPGIAMLHAPGETPGHAIVRIESGGQTCYALGDLFHHACEVAHLAWSSPWVDPAAMTPSRHRLIAAAIARDASLVYTHEPFAPWGRIVADGEGYRWVRDGDE